VLHESNFWLSTVAKPDLPQLSLPRKVDVAVIGGGFSGLSAARTLAKAGASVAVLEAETMGWGASCRNGGMVLTGMKLGAETLIKKYGRERARRLFELSLASISTVEQIVQEEEIDCSFNRCGHLEVAWKPGHFEGFVRAAEVIDREFGHNLRVVRRADLETEIGSSRYHGALVDEVSGGLNPAQYVTGLARAAAKAGAGMWEGTRVQRVESVQGGYQVETSRGPLVAEKVFVGTSGYTQNATPSLQKRIIPIGSYIIATEPLGPEVAANVSPRNRMIFDSKNFLYYFRLTPDNRMLFGGRAAFTPETPVSTRRSAEILRRGMLEIYPQLNQVKTEYVWGGTLDFAYDTMPHTGVSEGLYYSLGYAGHGVAFATHLGQAVARSMLGEAVENPLDGLPFPRVPLYSGNPTTGSWIGSPKGWWMLSRGSSREYFCYTKKQLTGRVGRAKMIGVWFRLILR
jgi:glycine/D-amino acid oxidase-like deaminating enzyme